jgi:CelD/BcsL family acetyltransferase involved in cellulose biosynthesis
MANVQELPAHFGETPVLPPHPRASTLVEPREELSVKVIENAADLEPFISAWNDLAANALEPNVFYEPWMLLPAIKAFGNGLLFVLVFVRDVSANGPGKPRLCGFFPFERERLFPLSPLRVLRLWKHRHCFLCTPLIRQGYALPCLEAMFDGVCHGKPRASLVRMDVITGDGPFYQALQELAQRRGLPVHNAGGYGRAILKPAEDAETYLKRTLSSGNRKELRRQRKRLTELGLEDCALLEKEAELDTWIDQFLELEQLGWKGQQGTALGMKPDERHYFRTIVKSAFRAEKLMMLRLQQKGQPIAMKCNFLSGEGAFAFKIAFDESYAKYSPGVQMELDNIRFVHARPNLRWMDSCAVPDHFMINRLWENRRIIHFVLMPTNRGPGSWLVRSLPVIKQWRYWWRRKAKSR